MTISRIFSPHRRKARRSESAAALGFIAITAAMLCNSPARAATAPPASAATDAPASASPSLSAAPAAKPAAAIVSTSHPNALFYSFSSGAIPFVPYAAALGVASGARLSLEDGALQLRNAYAGSFSVDTKTPPFDALALSDLYFDYKLTPEVKVNLFFRCSGVYYSVYFSGPHRVRAGALYLGTIEGVKADGNWHRAHVPLRDWLRKLSPLATTLPVSEVVIGNWDNTGYLMAGFGGNGPGASWSMRNWSLVGTGPGTATFVVNAQSAATWSLDGGHATPLPVPGAMLSVAAADGFHIVQVHDRAGATLAAYPFYAAGSAPRVGEARIANNIMTIPIEAAAGLDLANLTLKVDDHAFTCASPQLTWDGADHALLLDAAGAQLSWPEGGRAQYSLLGVKDLQGRPAAHVQGAVAVDYAQQTAKPRLPHLALPGPNQLAAGDFESSLDGWESAGNGGALVERVGDEPASGKWCLRLTCPANAVPFRAWIRKDGFDAAAYPVVTFWYKVPPNLRVDFLIGVAGFTYSIRFTDKDSPYKHIGEVANVRADNKWHRGRIDMRTLLRALQPAQPVLKVDWFGIGDSGWLGNARNTQYWLDDFYLAPAVPAPAGGNLTLEDISGLKAAAWVASDAPDDIPSSATNPLAATVELGGPGLRWLHARVQNGAGQWSDAVHLPVQVEEAAAPAPLPGDKATAPAQVP